MPDSRNLPPSDRLGAAAKLLSAVWVLAAASAVAIIPLTAPGTFSPPPLEQASATLDALRLSHLSLSPTGRPLRAPQFMHPGVDLRFSPWVGFPEPAPESLVMPIQAPDTRKGERP